MITTYFRERNLINRQILVKHHHQRCSYSNTTSFMFFIFFVSILETRSSKRSLCYTPKGLWSHIKVWKPQSKPQLEFHCFLHEAPSMLPPCCPFDGVDTTALGTKFRQTQISSFPHCFQQNALIGWKFSESYRKLLEQELAFLLIWVCMPSSRKKKE